MSLYVQFTLKDRPKDFRGLTQESWTFARNQAVPLSMLVVQLTQQICEWYGLYTDTETMNTEIQKAAEVLGAIRFVANDDTRPS